MAESLLDFGRDIDVDLLDQVVASFYTGSGTDQKLAQKVLSQFQDHEQAWTRTDIILEKSSSLKTKFIALQILERFVQTRWNTLEAESRDAIRTFVVSNIVKISSDEVKMKTEHIFLSKLNLVLVQILKQDWPRNWPSFIPDIVASSRTSFTICENNMIILKLLSEEIFDYSSDQLTHLKTSSLRNSLCKEFSEVFYLCKEVLQSTHRTSLTKAALDTLLKFLSWIPIGYIFETDLTELLHKHFVSQNYRNQALKCITEIGSLVVLDKYHTKIESLFENVVLSLNNILPIDSDIAEAYKSLSDSDQEFVQNLALFLSSFLTSHSRMLERSSARNTGNTLIAAYRYLIQISRVQDREIFKICLEYWSKFVQKLFEQDFTYPAQKASSGYLTILSLLRVIMIERMVKPEEVLVVENDEGEIVREIFKGGDTIVLYKSIKEVLVYLTNLDVADTERIMAEKLMHQMDGSEWSWQNLNQLCWAIGSISGAMHPETEKRFLVGVIKDLLLLCQIKQGKDNKAVVASNIMYIVGQYPRFVKAHWNFLRTVVNKLFEFMHESHEGVQDMACDTFIKVSQHCKHHFVIIHSGDIRAYVKDIIDNISVITSDLDQRQTCAFYEAVGYMISAQADIVLQNELINALMHSPNKSWKTIVQSVSNDTSLLTQAGSVKSMIYILKTNISACQSIGPGFISQLGNIYSDLLTIYTAAGNVISQSIQDQGPVGAKTPRVRGLVAVKRAILELIDAHVMSTKDFATIDENIVDSFCKVVLTDYKDSSDLVRDAGVLDVLSSLVERLGSLMTSRIPLIFEAVIESTLPMITSDFTEFPGHRTAFYKLLGMINRRCFSALLELSPTRFKLVVDSIIWGFKHTMRDIADSSLDICGELIAHFRHSNPTIAGIFYKSFYLNILQDIFFVLTDREHKSGFKGQTEVLALLFNIATTGEMQVTLYEPMQVKEPNVSNVKFLEQYVSTLLQNAFPHLHSHQVKVFVMSLIEYSDALPKFKLEIRDFLIQLKEFSSENAELFLEEKEAEIEMKRQAERKKALLIPGMLNPTEITGMDELELL